MGEGAGGGYVEGAGSWECGAEGVELTEAVDAVESGCLAVRVKACMLIGGFLEIIYTSLGGIYFVEVSDFDILKES